MANIHFFQPIFLLDFVPTPTVMEDHQNIADDINQSQKYALNRTIIAFVQFGDSVQSRGLMVVAHGGRSDIGQRFITQMDILESEILMTLGYVLKKNVVILYVVIYLIRMAYTNYKRRFNIFYGWYMVAAGTLLMATCFGISYSFSVYFPALQSDFSWNRAATSGVFSLYLVLVGFFSILCGRAIDRYGPKPVVLIMGVVTGISLILTAQVHALWQFYLSYSVLLAAGTGGMYIIVMSTASRWFYRKRATAMGILGTGASLGPVVMAPVSAWLIETYQWRAAYMLTGILAWILIIPGALVLKKDPAEIGTGLDGDLYFPTGSSGEAKKITAFSITGAIKSPSFSYLNFVWFWFSFCLYMIITHIVPRAQDIGLDPMRAAGVMSILTAVSAVSRVAGGMAADLVDKRKLLAALITAMALSMVWLTSADQSWKIYLFAILFGMVFGGGDPSLIAVVTDVFGTSKIGTMMGILMISWGLGSAAGPYLAGCVFDYTGSYGWAFIIAGGGLLLSTFAILRLKITDGRF